MQKIK